jgi:hypothetical protein
MKWAGMDVTSRDHLPYLQFGCRTIDLENPTDWEANGTTNADFDRVLRYVGKGEFRIRRKKHPSLESIRRHLKQGGAVCLAYAWEEGGQSGEHFCFIAGLERGLFVCVNDHHAPVVSAVIRRSATTLRRWLKKTSEDPCVWFLTLEI